MSSVVVALGRIMFGKLYFCLASRCGSRIFRKGCSSLKSGPPKELKKLLERKSTGFCYIFKNAIEAKLNVFSNIRI